MGDPQGLFIPVIIWKRIVMGNDIEAMQPGADEGDADGDGQEEDTYVREQSFKSMLENDIIATGSMMDDIIGHMSTPLGDEVEIDAF